MRILGIDPSTVNSGWALMQGDKVIVYGAISPPKKLSEEKKIMYTYNELISLIHKYKPDQIACEDQYGRLNTKTLKVLSRLVGGIMLACAEHDTPITLIYPSHVKKVFTGRGNASKQDMVEKAKKFIHKEVSDDIADAVAVAYTFLEDNKQKEEKGA